jgi:DNA repair protein RadC
LALPPHPNWLEKANFLWENEKMAESKKIKDLPEDERPREKLLKFGAEKLSDAELLAILLRTGVKGKSVLELAKEILGKSGGSFKGLAGKDIEEIMSIPGIKKDKITSLAAALEIARRISKQILKEKGII